MALNFLLKRSGTGSKRPTAASMALGELDLNYDASTGGLFYKDSAGSVVKIGPAGVGSTAPNATPAGSSGNSAGEFWYDTGNSVLKVYNGTSWVPTVSTASFLPLAGGTMTGVITFAAGQTFPVVSDARDKIVQGDVPHGLDFVNQLEPKSFYFKESRDGEVPNGPLRYGFLAQDILALEGDGSVIIDDEDSEKLRYNGEALVPVLVNAIKELSAKNDALEARINALENP